MITALDTNVLSEMMDNDPRTAAIVQKLGVYQQGGPLVICGAVYTELHAKPRATRAIIDAFMNGTGIHLDPAMSAEAWAEAGRANLAFHARRRASGVQGVRSVLPDLLIGAHAQHHAHRLFTLNPGDFSDFPALVVETL